MSNQLVELSDRIAAAVAGAAGHAVAIQGARRHPASGILWRPDAIVTADHALKRDEGLHILTAEGETLEATLAGRDPATDLAVLRLPRPLASAPPAASAHPPRPGQLILIVGRSPESGPQASMGILSAVGGPWRTWRGGKLDAYLRLDVSTYPGTSGSLVIDSEGGMVGMATAGLSRIAPVAVPTSTILRVVEALLDRGRIGRGFLGVGLQPVPLPPAFGIQQASALILLTVEPGSPAGEAGLIAGDILVSLDGHPVTAVDDVLAILEPDRIGQLVAANVVRGGQARQFELRIGERQ